MTARSSSAPAVGIQLKDPALFHDACFIDGTWVGASAATSIAVDNPPPAAAVSPARIVFNITVHS